MHTTMSHVLIVQIESHSMTDEVLSTGFKTELLIHLGHSVLLQVET